MNSTACKRCARTLTSEKSVQRGYGPVCARKMRETAKTLTGMKPEQVEKAVEIIEDCAIIQIRPNVFRVVSTNGEVIYLTTPDGQCNCPHGLKTNRQAHCLHVAAARMVMAA